SAGLQHPPEKEKVEFYIITKDDTLSKVATQSYGNANQDPKICGANREVSKNADLSFPGQKSRIPLDCDGSTLLRWQQGGSTCCVSHPVQRSYPFGGPLLHHYGHRIFHRRCFMDLISLIVWLVVGGLVGWIASMIMGTDAQQGIGLNIVVGVVGAFLAGLVLSPLVGVGTLNQGNFSLPALLISLVGSVILLAIVNLLRRSMV